jgi:hypothetical protein
MILGNSIPATRAMATMVATKGRTLALEGSTPGTGLNKLWITLLML